MKLFRLWARMFQPVLPVLLLLTAASCSPPPVTRMAAAPGDVVYFVPTSEKIVALTFDDGPNGDATAQILDSLKAANVPATFFLIGTNVDQEPALARRIAAEGHLIGNHSYSHPRFDKISPIAIDVQLTAAAKSIHAATGITPVWHRPPYGINGKDFESICRKQGVTIAGWSLDAGDWNRPTPEEITDIIAGQITPGDIILLHDGWETRRDANRQRTVVAVPMLIKRLQADGYRFVLLSELVQRAGPPLAEFSNGVRLLGVRVPTNSVTAGTDFRIRYFWEQPHDGLSTPVSVFSHFAQQGTRLFQDDYGLPGVGDVRDRVVKRNVFIPAPTQAGTVQMDLGLFNPTKPSMTGRISVRSAFPIRRSAVQFPVSITIQPAPVPVSTNSPVPSP